MKTIILLVNTFCGCFSWLSRLSPACLPCKNACHWATVTASAAAGRPGPRPHVEHHSHRTVVSRGAVESPSSAPPPHRIKNLEPRHWDRTVRSMTSCLCPPPPQVLVLIESVHCMTTSLGSTCTKRAGFWTYFRLWSLLISREPNATLLP